MTRRILRDLAPHPDVWEQRYGAAFDRLLAEAQAHGASIDEQDQIGQTFLLQHPCFEGLALSPCLVEDWLYHAALPIVTPLPDGTLHLDDGYWPPQVAHAVIPLVAYQLVLVTTPIRVWAFTPEEWSQLV
jgi:hypothetical protein